MSNQEEPSAILQLTLSLLLYLSIVLSSALLYPTNSSHLGPPRLPGPSQLNKFSGIILGSPSTLHRLKSKAITLSNNWDHLTSSFSHRSLSFIAWYIQCLENCCFTYFIVFPLIVLHRNINLVSYSTLFRNGSSEARILTFFFLLLPQPIHQRLLLDLPLKHIQNLTIVHHLYGYQIMTRTSRHDLSQIISVVLSLISLLPLVIFFFFF